MGKRRKIRHVVIDGEGDPCPRCSGPTEIREHPEITERQLRRRFYYSRWFYCHNPSCLTKQIMPERFIVWPEAGPERDVSVVMVEAQLRCPPGAL